MKSTTDAVAEFLTHLLAKGRAARTVEEYRCRCKRFKSLPGLLSRISPSDVDLFVSGLRADGLAKATIATYVQTLRTFFNWCLRRGYLRKRPAADLTKPKIDYNAREKAMKRMVRLPVSSRGWRRIWRPLLTASIPVKVPPPIAKARRKITPMAR